MKKVLFIIMRQPDNVGGAEKYARKFLAEFNNKCDIEVMPLYTYSPNYEGKYEYNSLFPCREPSSLITWILKMKKFQRILKKKLKTENYDYVIFNGNFLPLSKKLTSAGKTSFVSVQHNDTKILFTKKDFIKRILGILPSHYNSDKIICFTNDSIQEFKKILGGDKKYYPLPLFNDHVCSDKSNSKRTKDIYYIGRVDESQKNISLINDVSKLLQNKIICTGNSNEYPDLTFIGIKDNEYIYKNIYQKARAIILLSHYEGLPFVCIEALSAGCPIILRDSFTTAKFLVNDGKNGILIPKDANAKEIANIIQNTDFTKFNSDEIKKFANKNFSMKNFTSTWNKILNE